MYGSTYSGDKYAAWIDYYTLDKWEWGGLPYSNETVKSDMLNFPSIESSGNS